MILDRISKDDGLRRNGSHRTVAGLAGGTAVDRLARRRKLGEEVTRYLRDAVTSGTYVSGQRMAIQHIAGELGVSTMPVREALAALASEGLLEALPRRGFRVSTVRTADIEDTFRMHAFVAGLLAEKAARVITPAHLGNLRLLQARIQRLAQQRPSAARSSELERLNFEFHRVINWAPEAPRLRWFLRAATRYVPSHFYFAIPGWVDATVQSHPAILRALERHDAAKARRFMERHVMEAGDLVLKNLGIAGPRPRG